MPSTRKSGGKPRRSAGRPKGEDVAAIEEKLLATARKEFFTHGYGASSLSKIVKAAGVSKTTLYSRYASKEQLFRAIMNEQIRRLDAATALNAGDGRPDLLKGLKDYANLSLERSLDGEILAANRLVSSEAQRFPELGAAAAERTAQGVQRIAAFIRDCAQADGLPCRDADAIAEAFILMLRGWYLNAMLMNRKVSAAERQRWVDRAVHALVSSRADW
jgi:TetR/AcrR family transcriptional repressor of mexJK operon